MYDYGYTKEEFKNISMNSLLRTVSSIVASYDKLYEEDGNRDRLFMKELIDTILQVDILTSVYLRDGEIHPDYCLEKLDIMRGQVATQIAYWTAKKGD